MIIFTKMIKFTMINQSFPSKLLEQAVNELAKLPGIGRKTALRLVLHLLKRKEEDVFMLGQSIIELRKGIKECKICHNISDHDTCFICSDMRRDTTTICVVENIKDVMAIENTGQYKGVYHVLGGLISPMDGVGPADIEAESLVNRLQTEEIKEVILALSTTIEGDTTNYYIFKRLATFSVKITTLARGVAVGDELEYIDEITLGRSILNRTEFEQSFIQ
jgi:recombination protein RecR